MLQCYLGHSVAPSVASKLAHIIAVDMMHSAACRNTMMMMLVP